MGLPLSAPWISAVFASPVFKYVNIILKVIVFIVHPVLFSIHFYRYLRRKLDKNRKSTNQQKISRALKILHPLTYCITLTTIFFAWMINTLSLLNTLGVYVTISDNSCLPFTIIQNIGWIITKLFIYLVIVLRLQMSFWGSIYQYNRNMMLSYLLFVVIICLICIIGSFIDVKSKAMDGGWCLFIIPTWLILLPCAMDVICIIISVLLFIKPLRKIINNVYIEDCNNHKNIGIAMLMTKYIWLSMIAVFSNIASALLFSITDIAFLMYFDTLINPLCLVLMERSNQDIYLFCCKYCHYSMHRKIHSDNEIIANHVIASFDVNQVHSKTKDSINDDNMRLQAIDTQQIE